MYVAAVGFVVAASGGADSVASAVAASAGSAAVVSVDTVAFGAIAASAGIAVIGATVAGGDIAAGADIVDGVIAAGAGGGMVGRTSMSDRRTIITHTVIAGVAGFAAGRAVPVAAIGGADTVVVSAAITTEPAQPDRGVAFMQCAVR